MPDGGEPAPGGWNRIVVEVDDVEAVVAQLRDRGATFRNEPLPGPGGTQVLIEDPSGNPIEVFQPAS
jgi:catechol 2,3-dioxygenase-like lactoylglutathione lyase family enzyme